MPRTTYHIRSTPSFCHPMGRVVGIDTNKARAVKAAKILGASSVTYWGSDYQVTPNVVWQQPGTRFWT